MEDMNEMERVRSAERARLPAARSRLKNIPIFTPFRPWRCRSPRGCPADRP